LLDEDMNDLRFRVAELIGDKQGRESFSRND
jgi:hypothetical protein